jgi:hypothetical protein
MVTENGHPEELTSSRGQKRIVRTGAVLHNDVEMLSVGIRQGFENVIPWFQLFAIRDIPFYLDRLE